MPVVVGHLRARLIFLGVVELESVNRHNHWIAFARLRFLPLNFMRTGPTARTIRHSPVQCTWSFLLLTPSPAGKNSHTSWPVWNLCCFHVHCRRLCCTAIVTLSETLLVGLDVFAGVSRGGTITKNTSSTNSSVKNSNRGSFECLFFLRRFDCLELFRTKTLAYFLWKMSKFGHFLPKISSFCHF